MAAKAIPDGFGTVTPYLVVDGLADVTDFLKRAFDAREIDRMTQPGGRIMHAEVKIGDSMIMMGEPTGESQARPSNLYVYVPDVDATYRCAIEAGGKSLGEPRDQFYGDRSGGVQDPSGNSWWIATHKEDVSRDEILRRAQHAHGA